jgi:hypothetical protein
MLRAACWMAVVAMMASGGEPGAQPENGSDQGSESAVLSAQELFEDPRAVTDGTSVLFEQAVVRAKTGIVLRVAAARHEIFVVPADPSVLDFLAVGAHVDIQGTLRRPPAAAQARLVYAMSTREAQRLAHTRFYVDASSVLAAE